MNGCFVITTHHTGILIGQSLSTDQTTGTIWRRQIASWNSYLITECLFRLSSTKSMQADDISLSTPSWAPKSEKNADWRLLHKAKKYRAKHKGRRALTTLMLWSASTSSKKKRKQSKLGENDKLQEIPQPSS
eukprot:scaffold13870_cov77-Cyclotella_meneghiniana.AAC.6